MTALMVGTDRLRDMGLSSIEAERKAELFGRAIDALPKLGVRSPGIECVWAPGRIEFLGKHTDYAGGRSLLCAIERGIAFAAAARTDRRLRVLDSRLGEIVACELHPDTEPRRGHWANYPMTLARRIARNFPGSSLRGADVAIASDLPIAAGISSSAALMVGLFLVLSRINRLDQREPYRRNIRAETDLAGYVGAIENGYTFAGLTGDRGVGTLGGCEDQTAILFARSDALAQYSFCPVRFERAVPVPDGFTFVIAASGVVAEKTGNALEQYNDVSRKAMAILDAWRAATGRDDVSLAAAVTSSPDAASRMRDIVGRTATDRYSASQLVDRLEQFVTESEEIIPEASDALAAGDIHRLSALVDRSQRGAEQWLGNQIAETVWLARTARELGAVAASAFGAGFGGSVWALAGDDRVSDFSARWRDRYLQRFPAHAGACEFFMTAAGPHARCLD